MDHCILFALSRESRLLLRHFPKRQRLAAASFPVWQCQRETGMLWITETGVGARRCNAALRWLLGNGVTRESQIIAAGFAGALNETWKVGDILLAEEVVDDRGNRWPSPLASLHPVTTIARPGRLMTSQRLIGDPQEKQRLGKEFGAAAVDMESAAAAAICTEHGMSFIAIRAISDDVATSLSPQLVRLLGGSRVSIRGLVGAVARSPAVVGELWRLARATKKAAKRLAEFLIPLVS